MDIPKPPEELELRNIIDKLAQFVARNGPEFEQMTKNKQAGNPKFSFLFGGEFYNYYQYRVASERSSDVQDYVPKQTPITQSPMALPPPHLNNFYPQSLPPQTQPTQNFPPHFLPQNINTQFVSQSNQPPLPPIHQNDHSFMNNNSNNPNQYPPSSMPQPPIHAPFPSISNLPPQPPPFNTWRQPFPQQTNSSTNEIVNNSNNIDNFEKQIAQLNDQIQESVNNLAAQHKVLMEEEKQKRIDDLILKLLDDELKRMCEDHNINLNEFDKILQPIIDTCRKESIANGKIWIFNNCYIPEHYEAVGKHLLKRVTRMDLNFLGKLHLMYLINDLLNHCMRKGDEKLKDAISNIIVPAFSATLLEADDERSLKMNKLLKLWEMNQYLDNSLLDQLKNPEKSTDAYKTSLYTRFSEQIRSITNEQSLKYSQMEKQHNEFVKHCENQIQQIKNQKQQTFQPVAPSISNHPFPPPANSNLFIGVPPKIGQMPLPPPHLPPQLVPTNVPSQPRPPFPPHPGNFMMNPIANPSQPAQNPHLPFSGAPFSNQQNIHPFYQNSTTVSSTTYPSASGSQLPPPIHLAPIQSMPPMHPVHSSIPSPFPSPLINQPASQVPPIGEEVKPPYFDLPAGIMSQLIKLEDFDYNPIDPKEIRMPVLTPPDERLLHALEAFYAPPSHEHPRNSEGWEKLGLYEFFKAKSQARKDLESKIGTLSKHDDKTETSNEFNDNSSNSSSFMVKSPEENSKENKKSMEENHDNRSSSPPKRRYKEFKEEKSVTRSSRSRSRSRSRERRHRSKRSRSRSRSSSRSPRSRSRSHRSTNKSFKRKSRSRSPPNFSIETSNNGNSRLNEFNKGHQMLKKMGWSGSAGLGAKEQGVQDPIPVGDIREKSEQYRGIGIVPTTSNDPFECFRRNKGQAYIQRIKDGRRE